MSDLDKALKEFKEEFIKTFKIKELVHWLNNKLSRIKWLNK